MSKEQLETLIKYLAELLVWKDEVQGVGDKDIFDYEKELLEQFTGHD